ncbi:hypothetical protein UlMin_037697 [Ulmus minor]
MKVLKSYVRKGNNIEGCIAECYITEEALEYCAEYLKDVSAVGVPRNMNNLSSDDHGISVGNVKLVDLKLLNQAHQYVLENTNEVDEYKDNISSNMRWISHGPQHQVIKYQGYMINGVRFHTKRHDVEHYYQNSGVSVVANTMLVSSAKDKNPIIVDMWYYGVIEEIWLLDYNAMKIPVFKCDWVKNDGGVKVDDLGFTLVDLQRKGHKNDPFILASQANQVFYIKDPENPKWSRVIENSHEKFGNSSNDDSSDKAMNLHFPAKSSPLVETTINTLHDDESSYGERIPVSINRRGQFVGHNGTELQSYLGVLARQNVLISFPSWPKVSRELNDKIWEQAQAVYDMDVKARKLALSSTGSKWRQFKYKIAKNWMLPSKDNPEKLRKPPKEYNFISPKEWETFVAIRLSVKFKKISEQASLTVREKKYHHQLSRRGYANTEMDLQTQSGTTENVERHELWKIAHQTKSGAYANEEVKNIVVKMVI